VHRRVLLTYWEAEPMPKNGSPERFQRALRDIVGRQRENGEVRYI
jgi:hypothetical protein